MPAVRAAALLVAPLLLACTRPQAPPRAQRAAAAERTVFTDTALFRRICAEADSGVTATAGRCTPRDQRARPILP